MGNGIFKKWLFKLWGNSVKNYYSILKVFVWPFQMGKPWHYKATRFLQGHFTSQQQR